MCCRPFASKVRFGVILRNFKFAGYCALLPSTHLKITPNRTFEVKGRQHTSSKVIYRLLSIDLWIYLATRRYSKKLTLNPVHLL